MQNIIKGYNRVGEDGDTNADEEDETNLKLLIAFFFLMMITTDVHRPERETVHPTMSYDMD